MTPEVIHYNECYFYVFQTVFLFLFSLKIETYESEGNGKFYVKLSYSNHRILVFWITNFNPW